MVSDSGAEVVEVVTGGETELGFLKNTIRPAAIIITITIMAALV